MIEDQPTQRPAMCARAGTVTGLNSGSQPSMIPGLVLSVPGFLLMSRAVSRRHFLHGDGVGHDQPVALDAAIDLNNGDFLGGGDALGRREERRP